MPNLFVMDCDCWMEWRKRARERERGQTATNTAINKINSTATKGIHIQMSKHLDRLNHIHNSCGCIFVMIWKSKFGGSVYNVVPNVKIRIIVPKCVLVPTTNDFFSQSNSMWNAVFRWNITTNYRYTNADTFRVLFVFCLVNERIHRRRRRSRRNQDHQRK